MDQMIPETKLLSYVYKLYLPVYRGLALRHENFIGFGKMTAAEKGAASKWRRMGRLQNMVFGSVYQCLFAPCEIAPEKEDHSVAML